MGHQHYCYLHGGPWRHRDIACACPGCAMVCPECLSRSRPAVHRGTDQTSGVSCSLPPQPILSELPLWAARRSDITVLLVTGESLRDGIASGLVASGFTLLTAVSGDAACRILDARPKIQVVLTDVKLVDGSWDRILHATTRNRLPIEVVVILTGPIDKGYIDQHLDILEVGAYDVLAEPDIVEALQSVVESAAVRSLSRQKATELRS